MLNEILKESKMSTIKEFIPIIIPILTAVIGYIVG